MNPTIKYLCCKLGVPLCKTLALLLALSLHINSYAQLIPVRSSINIIPPYSVYLSDYVAPGSNKLQVNIIITDPNPSGLQAKLKISILGEGITLETKPTFSPTPLQLNTGVNIITTTDLAPYFDPANLNFQGLDRNQFTKSGRLKEGLYQFCVEVVEYNRNIKLSDKSCTNAWLIRNNPPIWNLPEANQLVKATNPQNMLFNWTPQHTGSPNSAFTVDYEFTLVEIWPTTRNPNDAINSQLPIFRTTTSFTSLIYGPSEPPLIPGRKYAIRLKAYDRDGRDLFVNSGYSEVRSFTFGEECKPPVLQKTAVKNYQKAKISWSPSPTNTDYTVRYRPLSGDKNAPWYYKNTLYSYANLDTLTEGLTYEMGIKANCGSITSDYIAGENFVMPTKPDNTFECKVLAYNPGTLSTKSKISLKEGDKVSIGGYDMTLTQVQSKDGKFTGKGIIVVPFMNNLKLSTHFQDILVNEDNIVTLGNAIVDRATLQAVDDKTKKQVLDGMKAIDDGFATADQYLKKVEDILLQVNNIIDEVPAAAKETLNKGKELIEKGKQLIANGSTEAGKELIERGKAEIKKGLASLKDGKGLIDDGVDVIKALFAKSISEKENTIKQDSAKALIRKIENDQEFDKLKKELEGPLYEPQEEIVVLPATAAPEIETTDDILIDIVDADNIPAVFVTPLVVKLGKASESKMQADMDLEKILKKLEWLAEVANNVSNVKLDEVVADFKKQSVSLLKKYAMDKLTGKQTEDVMKQITQYIDKKLDEIATAQ